MKFTFNDICEIVARCTNQVLNELHANQQLMIPFNGNSQPLNYMQFIEYLEHIGHYGQLKPAEQRAEDIVITNNWRFNYNAGLNFLNEYYEENVLDSTKLFEDIFSCMDEECFVNPEEEGYGFPTSGEGIEIEKIQYLLTEEGWDKFEEVVATYGKLCISGFLRDLTIDERGLIYIERVIDIREAFSNRENDNLDYYQELNKYYDGIGNCWTYIENRGDAYNSSLSSKEKTTVTLFGWVDPKDVDWETTFELIHNDEDELRLNAGCEVQIDKIMITDIENKNEGKCLPLKGSIIVNA